MAGYQKLKTLLLEELRQLKEEGKLMDSNEFTIKINEFENDNIKLMEIYNQLQNLPIDLDFRYTEPSDYEDIQKLCTPLGEKLRITDDELLKDSFYGAWLGHCIGCALGQPVELWTAKDIRIWLEKADAYPLNYYIPTHSRAESENNLKIGCLFSTDKHINGMQTDDDIRYTVLGLDLLKKYKFDFDTWDVAYTWTNILPYRQLCTAENQAYLNFINMDDNTPWYKPDNAVELIQQAKVNTYLNPYREWIGAQIRIDAYGYIAAGDPHQAAKLAYTDAFLSHTKNGIYGAMFFAALISAAFAEKDIDKCIDLALNEIPKTSRLHEAIQHAVDIAQQSDSVEDLVGQIENGFKQYHPVHTINNAALCVAAISYSKGDFHKALTTVVFGGLDTDCNGATVGSFMGALVGSSNIPEFWKNPLHDKLFSGIPDYHPVAISELANQSFNLHKEIYYG